MGRKETRICLTCREEKDLRKGFHPRYGEPGKWRGDCKGCYGIRQGAWKKTEKGKVVVQRNNNNEKAVLRFERYRGTEKCRIVQRRSYEKNKEKWHVRYLTRKALKEGVIVRKDECELQSEVCVGSPTEQHHPDYSEPLEVVWMCVPCHRQKIHHGCKG